VSVGGRVAPSRVRDTGLAYLALTKPRVIELLLVTAIPAMLLAHRGSVNPLLIFNTLVGGMLAAGGANTLNCVADADIDKKMKRTARRPLARAAVPTRNALVFGLVLSAASLGWLWWTTNLLSGLLAMGTIAFYVFVYTLLLKRRTSQNVVWGGAAGCMPVMIAWSAVTGTIGWPALVMFAIIFFWTPPHTWALAMRYKEDYQAAGVPMLPAVATERQVTKQILIYTWLTVAATLALALATGWLYTAVAVVAGVWRSSRYGCSCSRTTTLRWCSARSRSTRRWRFRRCSVADRRPRFLDLRIPPTRNESCYYDATSYSIPSCSYQPCVLPRFLLKSVARDRADLDGAAAGSPFDAAQQRAGPRIAADRGHRVDRVEH
jgi:protoheme IX farnesyltransferase